MRKTKIIAVANQKGGVGKTTTVVNIAANLSRNGMKVLCIDLDGQGNLSDYLGFSGENEEIVITDLLTAEMSRKLSDEVIEQAILTSKSDNVDYIPSDITLSTADMFLATAIGREMILRRLLLHKVFNRYDYILIDCLPSLGVLVVNALVAADGILIPVQTQKFALNGIVQFEEIMTLAKELNPTLTLYGVIETMTDNTRMAKAVDEALTERYRRTKSNDYKYKARQSICRSYKRIYRKVQIKWLLIFPILKQKESLTGFPFIPRCQITIVYMRYP